MKASKFSEAQRHAALNGRTGLRHYHRRRGRVGLADVRRGFRPIADEPEPVAFSAIWSPYNQSATLRNLLDLAGKMRREATR